MKKVLIFVLAISLLFVPVSAQENTGSEQNKPVLQILQEQGEVPFDDEIYNTDYYNYFELSSYSMEGIDIQGDFAIRMYDDSYVWSVYDRDWEGYGPLDEILSVTKEIENERKQYMNLVFSDHPIIVQKCYSDDNEPLIVLVDDLSLGIAKYVTDILSDAIYQSTLHNPDNEYTQILCFRNRLRGMGTAVYYVGTLETVVFYYQHYTRERMEFRMDEYHQYAHEYWNYMTSDEMNYDEDGDIVSGAFKSFEKFVKERKETENPDIIARLNKFWQSYNYVIIPVVAIAVCGVAALILHKKRKRT